MAASAAWHIGILVLLVQFGSFLWSHPRGLAMPNVELTWSGPIEDLPLISPGVTHKKPSFVGDPAKPLPQRGADAFHPRQTLISAPRVPTHPRQTLIRPDAPPVAPKFLPLLPNIIQLGGAPVRPQAKINTDKMIAKQPLQAKRTQTSVVPDIPNQEKNLTDLNFAPAAAPAKPALTISTGAAATVAAPKLPNAATAQNDAPPVLGGGENTQTIIALSATPGPAAPPVPVPVGNLSANVSISPDGSRRGTPGGSDKNGTANGNAGGDATSAGGTGGGNGNGAAAVVPGVTVSGGNPNGKSSISGLGGGSRLQLNPRTNGTMPGIPATPDSRKVSDIPLADRLPPGAPPEHIFGTRAFYSLNVNMPNISSASGSWTLKFAELDDPGDPALAKERAKTLSGPVPLRKVDPRYPQDMIREHVQGEVVLYAMIREDGSVDSIQVVRSLDPALDKSAMDALAEWKFTPASRNGAPVALEAVVHIPFRYARANY